MWDQPEAGVAAVTSYKITTLYPPERPVKTVSGSGLCREVVSCSRGTNPPPPPPPPPPPQVGKQSNWWRFDTRPDQEGAGDHRFELQVSSQYGQFLESAQIESGGQGEGQGGRGGAGRKGRGREEGEGQRGGAGRRGRGRMGRGRGRTDCEHVRGQFTPLPSLVCHSPPLTRVPLHSPHLCATPLTRVPLPSPSVVLPPPTNLTGSPLLQRGAVRLQWTGVTAVISGYQIMFRKSDPAPSSSSTPFSTYHSLVQGNTSVVIDNLAVGRRYDFQVRAKLDRTDVAMQAFPSEVVAVETYSGEYRMHNRVW